VDQLRALGARRLLVQVNGDMTVRLADTHRFPCVVAPADRGCPVEHLGFLVRIRRVKYDKVVTLVLDEVEVVCIPDPGRTRRRVEVDEVSDLGEPAERVENLFGSTE
jgi:hypothetical protein